MTQFFFFGLFPRPLDVNCGDDTRWSRQTGLVTWRGDPAFQIDENGEVLGTPQVDISKAAGLAKLSLTCFVALGDPAYYSVPLVASLRIDIFDDTCFVPKRARALIWAEKATGSGTCASECRREPKCGGYAQEGDCWLATSSKDGGTMTTETWPCPSEPLLALFEL